MQDAGYKPILAHPERYAYMDIEQNENHTQLGLRSAIKYHILNRLLWQAGQKMAEEMVDNQMVDFISSDMHHPRHAAAFEDALTMPYLEKLLFDYPLKNVML
jgi:protein-tyrosine phosphatase